MSRASTSLDLSEFFNNDDSDGHRLAEFLQKRRGGVQRQNFLFMNCEPERLSLNVQLEKLPPSQQPEENFDENNEKQQTSALQKGDKNQQHSSNPQEPKSVEKEIALLHGDNEEELSPTSPEDVHNKEPSISTDRDTQNKPVSPISPVRPQSPFAVESPPKPVNSLSPSPRPVSPRLSSIRKSGGAISPSDRLRRYSLKRLTRMSVGRRTLLQEFESTVTDNDFEPPVCSTPLSQPLPDKPITTSPINSPSPETQNSSVIDTEKSPATNESCCGHTDTLIRTLQRKDEELKNYMESIMENTLKKIQIQEKENNKSAAATYSVNGTLQATKSPLKRTYTVEKGNTPGQVILTPDKSTTEEQSPCHSKQAIPSKKLKTPERNQTRSMISIRVKSPQNLMASRNLNNSANHRETRSSVTNRSAAILETSQRPISVPNTPPAPPPPVDAPKNNVSIMFPSQDVEIPETQDLPTIKDNSIIIQSGGREMPVVVIPVNQHFNRTYGEEIANNNSIITAKAKQSLNNTQTQQTANKNAVEQREDTEQQLAEDNLKLTDILTDDEDETPKAAVSRTIENNSQAPLNLAPSATNIRTKRLRKRSISRRRLQMDNSQLLSTETETEPPPPAHSSRRMAKKKRIPLNRAPGTPLNGEKFAQELARMSNYEILDLRKRNSLGRVFAISGRKSSRAQEDAVKKQHQLEDQIEMELQRRNINDTLEQQQPAENEQTTENAALIDEYPSVPYEFRDSMSKEKEPATKENSFVDEKSSDRISFKNNINSSLRPLRRSSKTKEKQMPEVLKQYLEVSKMVSKNRNKSINNKSKRLLYTQGQSDSEEPPSPTEKANKSNANKTLATSRIMRKSLPYIPSPPKSDGEQITALKVVSPPPPLNITPRKSIHSKNVTENSLHEVNNVEEVLPPPPAGFESDSGVSSNNFNIDHHSTTTNTNNNTDNTVHNSGDVPNTQLETNPNNSNDNNTDNNNDDIFKKPLKPAPKRRGRKAKNSEVVTKDAELQETATAGSEIIQQSANDNNTEADNTDCSLRRSKRGQVPLKQNMSIFQMLYQQTLNRRLEALEKLKEKQKKKEREISKANKVTHENQTTASSKTTKAAKKQKQLPPVAENDDCIASLNEDIEILSRKKATKIKETKVKRKQNKNNKQIENFECSRITMNTPPPVDHLNNVFDQLKNNTSHNISNDVPTPITNEFTQPPSSPPPAPPRPSPSLTASTASSSSCTALQKTKPFKVRVARLKNATDHNNRHDALNICSSSSTTNSTTNSNYELFSWLLNMTTASDNATPRNEEIFKEMRISSASNLSFTEIQGIEYAFYDTNEKASLGYLRFKPRQIKEKKKTKRFHLHFVTLVGEFRITANDRERRVGVGDMVVIEKSVYYDIENLTDECGIIMVIKK